MSKRVSVSLALSLALLFVPTSVSAIIDCSSAPGTRPSTQDDVDKGLAQSAGTSCVRPTDSQQQNGGCESNPYEILDRQYRGGGANRCSPDGLLITPRQGSTAGIDAALACRLTKLFKAANDRGCQVKILSAYRSEATQACMCGSGGSGCAAAGNSCHQKGLAVDVSSSCIGWLRMAAPQFQLVFPYYGPHIQCAEHPQASVRSCNRPCNGGAPINSDTSRLPHPSQVPDTYFVPPAGAPAPASQENSLSDAIRRALGVQPPPPPPPPPQQQPQALPPSSQPQLTPISNLINTVPTSGFINIASTSPNVSPTSTFDLINAYIDNPVSDSIVIGVATSIALNPDTSDIRALTAIPPRAASGTVALTPVYTPQQTFTSGDLSNNPISSMAPVQNGALARLLASFRDALLFALRALRPFGGNAPRQESLE